MRATRETHVVWELLAAVPCCMAAAAAECDVELELWQLMEFVVAQLEKAREEPFLISEFKRLSDQAHRSYAKRFGTR